jgi:hypothetical protein
MSPGAFPQEAARWPGERPTLLSPNEKGGAAKTARNGKAAQLHERGEDILEGSTRDGLSFGVSPVLTLGRIFGELMVIAAAVYLGVRLVWPFLRSVLG